MSKKPEPTDDEFEGLMGSANCYFVKRDKPLNLGETTWSIYMDYDGEKPRLVFTNKDGKQHPMPDTITLTYPSQSEGDESEGAENE